MHMPLSFRHNFQCCSVATASLGFILIKSDLSVHLILCEYIKSKEFFNSPLSTYHLPSTKMVYNI